jgi:hypothetical protein
VVPDCQGLFPGTLRGSLAGVLGQMANFKGVADTIRDYQKSIQPWDGNEPADF